MSLINHLAINTSCTGCDSTTHYPFTNLLFIMTSIHFTLMSYWEPSFALISTFANIIILYSFSSRLATRVASLNVRFYYVMMAIADLLSIVVLRIIISFISYGITYITGGWINLNWLIEQDVVCKTGFSLFILSEQLSGFTLVLFSLERLAVVYWPLRAKSVLTFRRTWIATAVVLGIVTIGTIHLPVSIHSIRFRLNTYCEVRTGITPPVLSALFWFALGVESYFFPTAIITVVNGLILRRIFAARAARIDLVTIGSAAQKSGGDARREWVATLSLVIICLFHTTIYLPAVITSGYIALLYMNLVPLLSFLDENVLQEIGWIPVHFLSVAKFMNVLVFYLKIPYFRREVNRVLCIDRLLGREGTSSSSWTVGKSNLQFTEEQSGL